MQSRAIIGIAVLSGVLAGAPPPAWPDDPSGAGDGAHGPRSHRLPTPDAAKSGGGGGYVLVDSVTVDGGSDGDDESRGIALDAVGNLWVAGYVTVPGHGRDIWLAKYDQDLGYQDSVTVNGAANGDDEGYTMAFDQEGNLYLIGYMTVAGHGHDIWLGKFDSDLVLQDSITLNGTENGDDDGYGILFDDVTGQLYAAGTLREAGEGANAWLATFDTDLVVGDSVTLNGPIDNTDKARFMAFDDARHLFASGSMTQAVTDYDIWLAKFEADLTFVDQVVVPGPTTDEDKGYGIVFGGADTLFVTGTMIGTTTSYDIWMAAYDTDLTQLDAFTINGPVDGEDVAYLMAMDGVGRLYHTGVYTESEGGSNIWLARFDAGLELQEWITVDGPAGGYDTGMGLVIGPDNDVYVSAVVSDPTEGFNIWIGHFQVPTLFADGFESGDTAGWPVGCPGAAVAAPAAARTGAYGLQVTVSPPCGPDNDVLLRDVTVAGPLHVASCSSISAGDGCVVAAGGRLELTARTGVVLQGGFRVEPGGSLTAAIDDGLPYAAAVQDDSPDAETTYHAEFFVNLDNLVMASGDELELLVAYDGGGVPQLRVILSDSGGCTLEVRDDVGAYTPVPGGAVMPGWNKVALGWEAATDATVSVTVNNGAPATAGGIDNDTCRIESVRLGAVGGLVTTSSGTVLFDNFISWR